MRAGESKINPDPFTTRPEIDVTCGVVAPTHWIGIAVGMATLERGGNAFDAAVATAFTVLTQIGPYLVSEMSFMLSNAMTPPAILSIQTFDRR